MITYILKSASCLALLLFFYHFILEREKMHNFNRFYLLGSVLFSFLVPFATITIPTVPEIIETVQYYSEPLFIENTTPIQIEETFNYTQLFIGAYILVSFIFLLRFGRNLFKIRRKISGNKKIQLKKATLVLVEDNILPHTFWNYIIINKKEYEQGNIEEELFTHELTHVTQRHTVDVLLIELLQIVFWINPLFIFLKKAIQLNHEFLADEKVINQHKNTIQYQHLLLNKAAWNNEYYLASNLNYSLTKKRLNMMTTQSSQKKVLLKKLAVIPLLAGFIFLFAERVEAQEKQEIIETIVEQPKNVQKSNKKLTEEQLYRDFTHQNSFMTMEKDGKKISKKYNEMSRSERDNLKTFSLPIKTKKKVPTQKLIEDLKDKTKYAVWIDGKVIKNEVLNNFKASDFSNFFVSFVYKNARSERFPQEHQASLYTNNHFKSENIKRAKAFEDYKKKHEVVEIIEEVKDKNEEALEQKENEKNAFIGWIEKAVNDSPKPQEKGISDKEMKEYKTLLEAAKKVNIHKEKDIIKMQRIYKLMSLKQKNSIENVLDVIPPPINMKRLTSYNKLANKVKITSANRKEILIYLNEIYSKMGDLEKELAIKPTSLISPPSPPKSQEKEISNQEMTEYKALFTTGEKTKMYKQKDVEKMVSLYLKMSKKQQSSVSDIRKSIPPPPPMDTIVTYKYFEKKIKDSPETSKTYLKRVKEMYEEMSPSQKKQVTEPSRILPPPPPTQKQNEMANLNIVKEYKKKHKIIEKLKATGKHYVFKSESDKKYIDREFSELFKMYMKMTQTEKNKVPNPENPVKPYYKLSKGDEVWYKKLNDLTAEEKLILLPTSTNQKSSKEQILKAEDNILLAQNKNTSKINEDIKISITDEVEKILGVKDSDDINYISYFLNGEKVSEKKINLVESGNIAEFRVEKHRKYAFITTKI